MGWAWNWVAMPQLASSTLLLVLATIIYTTRPHATQNRRLALFLLIVGVVYGAAWGLRALRDDAAGAYAFSMLYPVAFYIAPLAYLRFIGTLDAPFARPLGGRVAGFVFVAIGIGVILTVLARPDLFIASMARSPHNDAWLYNPGVSLIANLVLPVGASLFGLAAAISARGRARTELAKRRATSYAVAFGTYDVLYAGIMVSMPFLLAWYDSTALGNLLTFVLRPAIETTLGVLLTFAILRTQLFDMHLRLKFALRQSTVAAIFVAVFFIVSESLAAFFSERIGTFLGIGAAGLLLLALAPLQRLAHLISDAAMPRVQDTPHYREYRKMQVYQSALEDAISDGVITERERAILDGLQANLGIATEDAAALERDVLAGVSAARTP